MHNKEVAKVVAEFRVHEAEYSNIVDLAERRKRKRPFNIYFPKVAIHVLHVLPNRLPNVNANSSEDGGRVYLYSEGKQQEEEV